ncbi:MAG TPA: ABATE domain-containing protein [Candidatus Sulfotelmatobacter sp.]|jgi:predicted RNA-binding Zn ribbon-like protein|nr:ABATE domain-containing protein [Candidatus Sulfotelmatobacter sp.]
MGQDWEGEIYTDNLKRRRPPRFELMGGAVCLDFVNTLDDRFSAEPKELLKHYVDLARFAEDTGILGDLQVDRLMTRSMQRPEEAKRALASALQLREAISEIFYALARKKPVPAASLVILNQHVQEAAQHLGLVAGRQHFEWKFESDSYDLFTPLRPIARDAAELLASDRLEYVRACASKTCEWLFLDESKNHRRRWCDMTKCGNRAKVKRFYTRRKKAAV